MGRWVRSRTALCLRSSLRVGSAIKRGFKSISPAQTATSRSPTRAFVTKHNDLIRGAQGDGQTWSELPTPNHLNLLPPTEPDASVQDLAQLYAAFARDGVHGVKTCRDFSDAVAMHTMIDVIYQAPSSETTVVPKEQS